VFIVDFGPNYDLSKLPRNALNGGASQTQTAAAAPAPPEANAFAPELARLRALLPVSGQLINDPSVGTVNAYGSDQHSEQVPAPDVPGGIALRVHIDKGGGDPWSVGAGAPIRAGIHKGDTIFVAFYASTLEADNGTQSGVIPAMNVQLNEPPWTSVASTAAQVPLKTWRVFYMSEVASIDIPAGKGTIGAQIGGRKQTIDLGPAFVFNLGPGVPLTGLPKNN